MEGMPSPSRLMRRVLSASVVSAAVLALLPLAAAPSARADIPASVGPWCTALFGANSVTGSAQKAADLMAGKADMGQGGIYTLAEHPDWKPQAGTDTSGDRHVNSLYWALPLLFRGISTKNQAMVDRFRQLLYYWIDDHQGARGGWVDGSIYGGLRTETLVCAAQTLGDDKIKAAALDDAQRMLRGTAGKIDVRLGNNTDLIRQTGAFAAYCWVGDAPGRDKAWSNIVSMAKGVVMDDGSDVEGSPGYAQYIEKLLRDIQNSATTCGLPSSDPIPQLRNRLIGFVAQATRPDFNVESIGDTLAQPVGNNFGLGTGDPGADWTRSKGLAGTSPTAPYATYTGGYVFGRAGFHQPAGAPDTFYSMRYTSSRPGTAHTHDDGLSMTAYSRGVEWIGDPGPYRYDNSSALRVFLKSRAAHSSVAANNVSRTMSSKVQLTTAASDWATGGNDRTCAVDHTWGSVTVTRCITYVRSIDALVVNDIVTGTPIKGKKARATAATRMYTERWQIPPGVTPTNVDGTIMQLASGDQRMDLVKAGVGDWGLYGSQAGSSVAWFTGSWGSKAPASVVSRTIGIPAAGGPQSLVTVMIPHHVSEPVTARVDGTNVVITRNGTSVTVPVPVG